jgi:hypothetical protein
MSPLTIPIVGVAVCTNKARLLYFDEFVAVPLKVVAVTVPVKVGSA